jgi:hypothetical protein
MSMIDPTGNIEELTLDEDFPVTRGIYVGADGDVKITDQGGRVRVIPGLAGGSYYPFRVTKIHSANTTVTAPATNILLLY